MAESQRVDAVIIGAGVAGLYQLYRLREQGLHVRVFDAASEVGGTWYWNRYPGARTDSLSHEYQYWFSDELLDEWDWKERFPSQSEIECYLNHVADRFDLRRDITFNTRVDAAHWDEATGHWKISTDTGETVAARFLITCLGPLSAPLVPPFEGHEIFTGEIVHTARWPREGVDLAGKRVGVVGTGATGIQVIQTIAAEVEHLTVFQRTANYALPMHNPSYDDNDRAALRARYPAIRSQVHHTFAGFSEDLDERDAADLSPEERRHTLERLYQDGSLKLWIGGFKEVFFDEAINEEISEFVRERIRARIDDPAMAEKLVPTDHGFGTRRVPLETNYFEAYNRDNVDLVDIKATPIECFTEAGIRTADAEYPLDVIILATGFDAGTGGLTAFDIRGRDGVALADQWSQEIRTTMGLQIHGYPNLFTTSAPFAPASAFCNAPTCLQQQVDWIADCIAYLNRQGRRTIEPTPEMEQSWIDHHDELAAMTLIPRTKSWYTGANVAGKQQRLLGYIGGVHAYGQACEDLKTREYEGFAIA